MPPVTISGRDAFVRLLIDEGVTHLFGNPGTTELAVMEAVPNFPALTYVLGLQESIVVGMADGFARASGRLAACNLHCAPGLGHAMGALYGARFCGSPLIVTAGQYEHGYGLQEPMLYEPLVPIAAPLVKWAVEVPRIEDLPRVVRRAAKIALAPPTGPVFISLPGDILDAEAQIDLGAKTRVEPGNRPSDRVLERLAVRLLGAGDPVIVAGRELASRDAFAEAGELAQLLGAAVYHEPVAYNARFPSEHPAFLGDLTRSQPRVREMLQRHDLLLCIGADLLRMSPRGSVDPLPEGLAVVHVAERDWELGKNYPTEMAVCADVKETLRSLLPLLRSLRTPEQAARADARLEQLRRINWSAQRERARLRAAAAADAVPVDLGFLTMCIADALPRGAVLVEEAITAAAPLTSFVPATDSQSFFGLASGGLGFAMPGAIGVSLAQPGRPVLAAVGDGSSLYAIQALWTAAHLALPITYVIINNRGYRIIKDRLVSLRGSDRFVGMDIDEPAVDFVAVAQGFGVAARRVSEPGEIMQALQQALASGKPNLIEVIVTRR
jgi:benzoylformate decarboxylase